MEHTFCGNCFEGVIQNFPKDLPLSSCRILGRFIPKDVETRGSLPFDPTAMFEGTLFLHVKGGIQQDVNFAFHPNHKKWDIIGIKTALNHYRIQVFLVNDITNEVLVRDETDGFILVNHQRRRRNSREKKTYKAIQARIEYKMRKNTLSTKLLNVDFILPPLSTLQFFKYGKMLEDINEHQDELTHDNLFLFKPLSTSEILATDTDSGTVSDNLNTHPFAAIGHLH